MMKRTAPRRAAPELAEKPQVIVDVDFTGERRILFLVSIQSGQPSADPATCQAARCSSPQGADVAGQ